MPYAWVEQTKPGGVIVTPVRADLNSGPLVRFAVYEDGTATGRMAPLGVEFMEVRAQRTPRNPGLARSAMFRFARGSRCCVGSLDLGRDIE